MTEPGAAPAGPPPHAAPPVFSAGLPIAPYEPPAHSPAERLAKFVDALWTYFGQDAMPRMAAALAYRTIFSLVPLLLCGFLVLRLFQSDEKNLPPEQTVVGRLLNFILQQTGLAAISTDQGSVAKWITELVDKFQGINFGAVGLVSAAVLIYAAISLLVDIESSFNFIYNASRGRSWVRRIMQYWLVVSLGPLLLYLSFLIGQQFETWANTHLVSAAEAVGAGVQRQADGTVSAIFAVRYAVTTGMSFLLLLALYLTVPNTAVSLSPAASGALVSAVLLELAKYGFARFFSAEGYKNLYGALAILPLCMLWIYIIWFIVLFGLRVSFLVQHGRTGVFFSALRMQTVRRGIGTMWADPARSVGILVGVAEAFQRGRTANLTALAEGAQLDEATVRVLMERLEDAGLVHRIASEGREDQFTLSRPAESVTVAEIVAVGQALTGPTGSGAGSELVQQIRSAQLQAVQGMTLASLVARSAPGKAPPAKAMPPAPGPVG
jgi:YihY family inner membrane protein